MTDEIVTRLRIAGIDYQRHVDLVDLLPAAATEIERLRKELEMFQRVCKRQEAELKEARRG